MLTANVIHSVPEKGWGLAETAGGQVVFFRLARAVFLRLRGQELLESPAPFGTTIPACGSEIVFNDFIPAERGGSHPQVKAWVTREHWEKMDSAVCRAEATLAQLAAENTAAEAKRRAEMERLRNRRLGSAKKGGKKKGKRVGATV